VKLKALVFHPLTVLTVSVGAVLLFAVVAHWRFDGDFEALLVYYFAPIGAPFVAFLFDRAEKPRFILWWLDASVIVLSLARGLVEVPLISGHALFLTYALLTTRTRVARLTALVILLQVAYLKLLVWQDLTFFGGMVVGITGVGIYQQITKGRLATV
jgi:hypothetical protein